MLLIAAVLLAEDRRPGFGRAGLTIVAPMVLALVSYSWASGRYNDNLPANVRNPDAATALFDATTRFVQRAFRALLVLGPVVLAVSGLIRVDAEVGRRAEADQLVTGPGRARG